MAYSLETNRKLLFNLCFLNRISFQVVIEVSTRVCAIPGSMYSGPCRALSRLEYLGYAQLSLWRGFCSVELTGDASYISNFPKCQIQFKRSKSPSPTLSDLRYHFYNHSSPIFGGPTSKSCTLGQESVSSGQLLIKQKQKFADKPRSPNRPRLESVPTNPRVERTTKWIDLDFITHHPSVLWEFWMCISDSEAGGKLWGSLGVSLLVEERRREWPEIKVQYRSSGVSPLRGVMFSRLF